MFDMTQLRINLLLKSETSRSNVSKKGAEKGFSFFKNFLYKKSASFQQSNIEVEYFIRLPVFQPIRICKSRILRQCIKPQANNSISITVTGPLM